MLSWMSKAGLAVGMAALFALVGCRARRQPVIAVIPETTAQEIWESEHAGVEKAGHALGWSIYWNGPSREDNITRQIQLVNQEMRRHVAGLILSPDHAIALIAPVRAAMDHGIPTVILGSRLAMSPSAKLVFILNDDAADGRLAAERALLYLKPSDAVAVLGVDPNILGSLDRADAFETTIHRKFPHVRIVERRLTSSSFDEADEIAEEVIRSTPNLRVILSLNINQTRGAYQALRDTGERGRIRLIGCDQDLDLVYHLRFGGIDSLIAENTNQMGVDAIASLHKQMLGQPQPDRVLVEPVLVTRKNVDTAAVQQKLDMNWADR